MASNLITYSSELMSQFKQAEVAAPDAKFEALQTDTGCSLLFSIGTDGIFYVTEEVSDHTTGWEKTDLSSVLAKDFGSLEITTRTFAVAQNRKTNAIDMAVVVTAAQTDMLYLSLGNSSSDTSWIKQPNWIKVPFDDLSHPLSRLVVVNVFISQASDGEYIVVDVLRNPADALPVVFRYYIDPTKKILGRAWNPHDVAADLDASKVTSCLGRRKGDRVDGIYTLGEIGGHTSLIYQPLYNPFNPRIPANPARLLLSDPAPSAIASVAINGNATDLYVAGKQALYYFPYDNQRDGATAIQVFNHPILEDVTRLFAFATKTHIIIWGLNRAQQVFYTSCELTQVRNPAAWSYPLSILDNVEQLSPYVNRANDGNTFFAHTGTNQLTKAIQNPATTTWKFDDIRLPALLTAKAIKFNSYTTRIQVTDAQQQALANTPIQISAVHRATVYINNRYYVLAPTPIPIMTNAMGGLVIVEPLSSLESTCLRLHNDDGSLISINPMDNPFQKVAQLNTKESLTQAVIPGTTQPLVPPTVSDTDRQGIVDAIATLGKAYSSLPADGLVKSTAKVESLIVPSVNVLSLGVSPSRVRKIESVSALSDFSHAIEVFAGDVLNRLKSAANYVIHIIQESELWHFVVEIEGQVYRFALDAAAKVVNALEFVFKWVKIAFEKLIDYLKFFFEWDDFVRTKDVFKKLLMLHFNHLLDDVEDLKEEFNQHISDAKDTLDAWAQVKPDSWHPGVSHSNQPLGFLKSITDYAGVFTAPGMMLIEHLMDNLPHSTIDVKAEADVSDSLLDQLIQALADQGNIGLDAINRINAELLSGSQYESLSLSQVLEKVTAISLDAVLNTTENGIDLLLDVFVRIAHAAVEALDTPIWIPVVSDILEDAFGIDISFSVLDVFCMAGAIPATLFYKAKELCRTGKRSAPFSANDGFSNKILAAKDVYELQAAFSSPHIAAFSSSHLAMIAEINTAMPGKQAAEFVPVQLPADAQNIIFLIGHLLGGIVATMTAVLAVADVMADKGDGQYGKAVAVSSVVGGIGAALTAVLAQPFPIQNSIVSNLNKTTTGLTLLGKVAFKIAPYAIAKKRGITDAADKQSLADKIKKIGSGFDATIATIALVPSCYHFYELSKEKAGNDRSEAFIDETSKLCNYFSRILSFAVQMDKDPDSKAILAGIMGVLIALYGGLQIAESITEAA